MAQAQKWLSPAQYLFIPLIVQNVDGYSPPPANFREYVQRRQAPARPDRVQSTQVTEPNQGPIPVPVGRTHWDGIGRRRTITVQQAIVGDFVIQISTDKA